MTTYPTQYLSDISNGLSAGPIPEEKLVYFRARLKNRIHAMVLDYFVRLVKDKGFTKADLARRLNKRPEQITRWLGSPTNLTLDTMSDLLLGMGHEPLLGAADLSLGAVRPSSELWKIEKENRESIPENLPQHTEPPKENAQIEQDRGREQQSKTVISFAPYKAVRDELEEIKRVSQVTNAQRLVQPSENARAFG